MINLHCLPPFVHRLFRRLVEVKPIFHYFSLRFFFALNTEIKIIDIINQAACPKQLGRPLMVVCS